MSDQSQQNLSSKMPGFLSKAFSKERSEGFFLLLAAGGVATAAVATGTFLLNIISPGLPFIAMAGLSVAVTVGMHIAHCSLIANKKVSQGQSGVSLDELVKFHEPRVSSLLPVLFGAPLLVLSVLTKDMNGLTERAEEIANMPLLTKELHGTADFGDFVQEQCNSNQRFQDDNGDLMVSYEASDGQSYRINCPSQVNHRLLTFGFLR